MEELAENDKNNLIKFFESYIVRAKVLKHINFVNGKAFDKELNPFDDDDNEIVFSVTYQIENVLEFIETIDNYRDRLSFVLNLKSRAQHDLRQNRFDLIRKPFLEGVEIEILKYKELIQLPSESKKAVKNDDEFSLRRKIFILMLLTFGRLDKPDGIVQERFVDFFRDLIGGGDVTKIRKAISNPTGYKESKREIISLLDDLNFVRDKLGKLGFTEEIDRIKNEVEFIIEDLEEEKSKLAKKI